VRKREHVSLGKLLGQRDNYACKLPKAILGLVGLNVKEVVCGSEAAANTAGERERICRVAKKMRVEWACFRPDDKSARCVHAANQI
jgi:hypothetical protein